MKNFKVHFLLFLMPLYALYAQESINLQGIAPENIELAWDGHEVLVKPHILNMLHIGVIEGMPKVAQIIACLGFEAARYCWDGSKGQTGKLLYDIYNQLKTRPGVTAEEFKDILNAYDPSLWPLVEKMAAEHYPIKDMQEIVDELHALGYTQRMATNMGAQELKNIVQKNPTLFKNIDSGLTVDINVESPIRKPSQTYFNLYQSCFNPNGLKTIIFVDDKLKNVTGAQQCAMIGIHFKNAAQLRAQLKTIGIPLS